MTHNNVPKKIRISEFLDMDRLWILSMEVKRCDFHFWNHVTKATDSIVTIPFVQKKIETFFQLWILFLEFIS